MGIRAQQFRVSNKERRENITISFDRFQCLRAIAHQYAQPGHMANRFTRNRLLTELSKIEARDLSGIMEEE